MVGVGGCGPVVVVEVGVGGTGKGEDGERIKRGRREEGEGGETGVSKEAVWSRSWAVNRVCPRSK